MSPYDVLGVRTDATDEEIAKAHKRLAKKYHPDLHPGNEAAARKMGEINRAYDEIKSMRQHGAANQRNWQQEAYQRRYYDPFYEPTRSYQHYYQKPRTNPMAMILAVLVMILFVRLVLNMLFGGFGGSYYVNPAYYDYPSTSYGYIIPGYQYSQPIP